TSNTFARSCAVAGGNNAMCSSARPWRFRSTGTRSGRLVIRNQITFPRRRVSPMNAASDANTRSETPESSRPDSRVPSAASASSTTTATGPIASSRPRIRSTFASVCPCHLERKLSSFHRDPDLPREAAHDEALPRSYGSADQVAHRHDVEPSPCQRLGGLAQQRLRRVVPGDLVETHIAGHEREQAAARFLDQPLLLARERVLVERGAARFGIAEQALQVQPSEAGREDGRPACVH